MSLKIPPHLKRVTALPCETLFFSEAQQRQTIDSHKLKKCDRAFVTLEPETFKPNTF